ncbi:MAG: L-serine ammonia-lyase, iron-sulfur-dependent, subunit alpha [Clostridia bacterium]|nr:L-serine ammonia-lyase, iron-sulfur-dependent, subunit alpha [Clostridia bacterium]
MYDSLNEICLAAEKTSRAFWQIIMEDDCAEQGITEEQSMENMRRMYAAMKQSDAHYEPDRLSGSGLVGTEAAKLRNRRNEGKMIADRFTADIMIRALRVSESNACMKRIVAAPTAGSCGVLPAVLITAQKKYDLDDDKIMEAVFVAGGIGGVIANRASISGAEGGCQAEIGSASAMAAGALTYLMGGDCREICNSAALALKSLLGLACDPVAGLVEVPCVKRNVIGAVNAVTATDMSLAGIMSKIPPDEVIDAMRGVATHMGSAIRETGEGGLATTPTGIDIRNMISMAQNNN